MTCFNRDGGAPDAGGFPESLTGEVTSFDDTGCDGWIQQPSERFHLACSPLRYTSGEDGAGAASWDGRCLDWVTAGGAPVACCR